MLNRSAKRLNDRYTSVYGSHDRLKIIKKRIFVTSQDNRNTKLSNNHIEPGIMRSPIIRLFFWEVKRSVFAESVPYIWALTNVKSSTTVHWTWIPAGPSEVYKYVEDADIL